MAGPVQETEHTTSFSRGIFRAEKWAWVALLAYVLLLYSTLTLVYDLYISVYNDLGKRTVGRSIYGIAALLGIVIVLYAWRRLPRQAGTWLTLLLIGVVTWYAMSLEDVPANRIHFFQYCPLGILCLEALRFRIRDRYVYPWSFLLVALIGTGDEFLQGLLPNRHFDSKDVALNALAGALALAFVGFAVRERYYPWGRKRD